jgi:fructose-1,6-bisphosphatase
VDIKDLLGDAVKDKFTKKVIEELDIDSLAKVAAAQVDKSVRAAIKKIDPDDFDYVVESLLDNMNINPIRTYLNKVIKENF